jgi:hypothetical protein
MKSATKYVCWVAGLALALGIWTWLASVPWPASASPADTAVSAPVSYRGLNGITSQR